MARCYGVGRILLGWTQPDSPGLIARARLAPAVCAAEQLLRDWLSRVPLPGLCQGTLQEGNACGQLVPSPAEQLPCCKGQLLLVWHFSQLSAPEFFVSSPNCFVLPSCLWPAPAHMALRVLAVAAELSAAGAGDTHYHDLSVPCPVGPL